MATATAPGTPASAPWIAHSQAREGNYFPSLLEPRRRSEKALLSQQAYVEGVSTRRVDDLIKALGCDGISSSQVSRICGDLDEVVDSFLGRPLDGGPYPYVWLDGLTQKVREGGRIVNVCVVVATGVNAEGQREVLGMDVGTSEDGAFWLAFLRSLTARGLSGVELVTSDAHQGLKNHRRGGWGGLATLPHSLHGQPAHPSTQARPTRSTMVPPFTSNCLPWPTGPNGGTTQGAFSPGGGVAGGRCAGHPGLHGSVPLAEPANNPSTAAGRSAAHVVGTPNGCRHGAWWARWPSSMTNGPKPAATSPSPTPLAATAGAQSGRRPWDNTT